MDDQEVRIMNVRQARQVLTRGDIRDEVAFQNDVNRLLASLEEIWGSSQAEPAAQG